MTLKEFRIAQDLMHDVNVLDRMNKSIKVGCRISFKVPKEYDKDGLFIKPEELFANSSEFLNDFKAFILDEREKLLKKIEEI